MTTLLDFALGTILVGFDGIELTEELRSFFSRNRFAGYILFARNVESVAQTRRLTDTLRSLHPKDEPPIIAIDQEGGRVARLRRGVEEIPSMMALGATRDGGLAQRAGEQLAFDLRRAGITLDFAPVLDLAVDRLNTVIGARSFGSDPHDVAALARAFANGLERGGITPTFKHFPGHGSTSTDSHLALPEIDLDETTWRERDLLPFQELARTAHAFMTAHVVVRAVDAEHPATLSRTILTYILRNELHFDGVCFTDCMEMDAIARGVGTIEGVRAAIAAGADCALISHDPRLALDAARHLAAACERGDVPIERLREARQRVLTLQQRGTSALPLDARAPHPGIGREIGRRAVTVLRGIASAVPTSCIEVSFESTTVEGVQGVHSDHSSLAAQSPALLRVTLPLEPEDTDVARALEHIVTSGRRAIVLSRRSHIYASQAQAIERVLAREPDALLVSLREPFDAELFPQARHVVATYGDEAPSIAGLADVIFGGAAALGRAPLRIEMHGQTL
jgi:beta-N-acetylhexosaminidase